MTKDGWIREGERSDGKSEKERGPGWLPSLGSSACVDGDDGYHLSSWEI